MSAKQDETSGKAVEASTAPASTSTSTPLTEGMNALSLTDNVALIALNGASKTRRSKPALTDIGRDDSTTLYPKILKQSDFVYSVRKYLPPMSSIHLTGSVKLHGTHADIIFQPTSDTIRCQSRNKLAIAPGNEDNYGCAAFVAGIEQRKLLDLRDEIMKRYRKLNPDTAIDGEIVLAGEWCGIGVQKRVALNEIPKSFVIISIKINGAWVPDCEYAEISNEDIRIFHIGKAGFFKHELSFDDMDASDKEIKRLTDEVEKECPFSKLFGISGLGEGIVWKATSYCADPGFWFKSKGDILAVSHSGRLPASAVDKENKDRVENFAKAIVTEMRMEQGWRLLSPAQKDSRGTKSFLKWVVNDCLEEEKRQMEWLGIRKANLSHAIMKIAKTWFIRRVAVSVKEPDGV